MAWSIEVASKKAGPPTSSFWTPNASTATNSRCASTCPAAQDGSTPTHPESNTSLLTERRSSAKAHSPAPVRGAYSAPDATPALLTDELHDGRNRQLRQESRGLPRYRG